MSTNVNITSKGIQKILRKYTTEQAVAEFIWNGFDAKADSIELKYNFNELGLMDFFEISDNGYGINFKQLKYKFENFYESEKTVEISTPKNHSTLHGKNGVGRLTFFTFAHSAEWLTVFLNDQGLESGKINIDAGGLNRYVAIPLEVNGNAVPGTKVIFHNVLITSTQMTEVILPFLISEFCWFLELNKSKKYKILVNGVPLDIADNIVDIDEDILINYEKGDTKFNIKFIQWKAPLHKELSKYYFINSENKEVYKDYTTLNKKGDEFYHSVYIQSAFFDNFNFNSTEEDGQYALFGKARSSPEYKFLIRKVNDYIRSKRKPYLRTFATRLVEKYEQDGIFPVYANEWEEKFKKPQLEETLIGLYEAQPKLFTDLNGEQKKTFVRFLDLLLDSNERDRLFVLLDGIVDLEPEERQDLAELLKTTRLNRIIETIKLIESRYKTIYKLKELVFNHNLGADEVHHLQKVIESHYWIFGEQYHLVCAAEVKFEEALHRYKYLLTEKDDITKIDHPHKLKEMDIFACRQNFQTGRIDNIVIELKHPSIALGEEQYSQVHKYLQVVSHQPEFNAGSMHWEFILVGNKFNTSKYVQDLIDTNKNHGIPSLALSKENGRIKILVKTWSEIFAEFEIKHRYLDERLKLERDLLINELPTANMIVSSLGNNLAIQPEAITVFKNN